MKQIKINLEHFSFNICPMKISDEILKEYEETKKIKNKTEYDKFLIQMIKLKMQEVPVQVVCKHLRSGVEKCWQRADASFDKEALARETIALIALEREKRRVPTSEKLTFDGATYLLVGGVHQPLTDAKKHTIVEMAKNTKSADPLQVKKPRIAKANYVGIELEFNTMEGHNITSIGAAFKNAGLSKFVQVDTDRSCGFEVRVLLQDNAFEEPLKKIMSLLKTLGFKADDRCGTHVHLDMRNRNAKLCYKNLFKSQEFLRQFINESRKNNIYCKVNKTDDFDTQKTLNDRRHSINVESHKEHGTIEIRMHHGTLEYDTLAPWIKLLLKIVRRKDEIALPVIKDLKEATNTLELEAELFESLQKRLETQGA